MQPEPLPFKILVVEDDENVQELLRLYLSREGYTVVSEQDGARGLTRARRESFHLVILDIMLPGTDGWNFCREFRRGSSTPIIMLTARDDDIDKILGLELGADDYVTKPFNPRELVARVKAVLRRVQISPTTDASADLLQADGIVLDTAARTVEIDGNLVSLTPKEFDLLACLLRHPGRVFTREKLLEIVWGYEYFGDSRTVDVHVKRLREKLDAVAGRHFIVTVWGIGYKFEADQDDVATHSHNGGDAGKQQGASR